MVLVGLGPWEIGLIVVAILLVFGAGRLTGVGKALGTSVREFRSEAKKPTDQEAEDAEQAGQANVQASNDESTQGQA